MREIQPSPIITDKSVLSLISAEVPESDFDTDEFRDEVNSLVATAVHHAQHNKVGNTSIVQRTLDAACDFECATGKKPVNLYLGRTEFKELADVLQAITDCTPFMYMRLHYFEEPFRPEFIGCHLFAVNAVNHLSVS